MREVFIDYLFKRQQQKTGELGMIIEVDESTFMKRKNNAGRILPHYTSLVEFAVKQMFPCEGAKLIHKHYIRNN